MQAAALFGSLGGSLNGPPPVTAAEMVSLMQQSQAAAAAQTAALEQHHRPGSGAGGGQAASEAPRTSPETAPLVCDAAATDNPALRAAASENAAATILVDRGGREAAGRPSGVSIHSR